MGSIFSTIFYEPLYNALIIFYHLLGDNIGLAIIAIAVVARAIMIPLTLKQIKMAESNKEFSEKVKEVKKQYKNDKEKQQQELMKLQSQYLPAQLGGCLPMIFQFIFFIYMYKVIRDIVDTGAMGFNKVAYNFVDKFPDSFKIDGSFFGIVNLMKSPSNIASEYGVLNTHMIPYILMILAVGGSQYLSMKILSAMKKTDKVKEEEKAKEKKKENKPEDFGEIMQRSTRQTMLMMPIMIMFISYSIPAGLGLYWITQSVFVIIQQAVIKRIQGIRKKEGKAENKNSNIVDADRDAHVKNEKKGAIGNQQLNVQKNKKKKDKKKKKEKRK